MTGTLYGVGVGPGDPELMTLKAVKIIKACDIIAIPATDKHHCVAYNIALQAVPELETKEILPIVMPMVKDRAQLSESHESGANLIACALEQGKNVAFLTLGDPTVYSTYIYIHKRIENRGYMTQIINGIPSFCAVAARLNISLAENSESIHIVPSSYDIVEQLKLSGTKILMKSGKKIADVKKELKVSNQKAVMVENCGMENEKIYSTVDEIPEDASYYSLIIVK